MAELKMDTLKFAEDLEATGLSREQSRASSEAVARVFATAATDLANKQDMNVLHAQFVADLKTEMVAINTNIADRIHEAYDKLFRWALIVGVVEVTAIIVAVVVLADTIAAVHGVGR